MAVSITWSLTANGASITSVDHGSAELGQNTSEATLFLRHNGSRKISNCALFIAPKTSGYTGDFNANTDHAEIISWGDANVAGDFGGVQINMDAEGGFSGGSTWGMSESQKTSTDGLKFTIRTGVGDSLANAVTLSEKTSVSVPTNGEIPPGVTTASFKTRVKIPSNESVGGFREYSLFLKYSYTS